MLLIYELFVRKREICMMKFVYEFYATHLRLFVTVW